MWHVPIANGSGVPELHSGEKVSGTFFFPRKWMKPNCRCIWEPKKLRIKIKPHIEKLEQELSRQRKNGSISSMIQKGQEHFQEEDILKIQDFDF